MTCKEIKRVVDDYWPTLCSTSLINRCQHPMVQCWAREIEVAVARICNITLHNTSTTTLYKAQGRLRMNICRVALQEKVVWNSILKTLFISIFQSRSQYMEKHRKTAWEVTVKPLITHTPWWTAHAMGYEGLWVMRVNFWCEMMIWWLKKLWVMGDYGL